MAVNIRIIVEMLNLKKSPYGDLISAYSLSLSQENETS